MVEDLEKSSFSNIEQQSLEFVKYTLDPWVIRWEQSIMRALLSAAEKKDYFVKEALIKSLSDFATSIMMQDREKDDANSELFKESFDAVLHHYAAKSDSSI